MKANEVIFKFLRTLRPPLERLGIGKIFPHAKDYYDELSALFLARGTTWAIEGSKMHLDLHHSNPSLRKTFRAYAFKGQHETVTTDLFKKIVRPGDCIVDLGANIGYFTLLAAKLTGPTGRVVSFEPDPTNFQLLQQNVALNNYSWVTPVHGAVGNRTGKEKLFICPYDTGHHTLSARDGIDALMPHGEKMEVAAVEIDITRLDDYFYDPAVRVNVIKIDIEGSEMGAFLGMRALIERSEEISIFVEYFPLLIEKMGDKPEEFLSLLFFEYKFDVFAVSGDYSMNKGNDVASGLIKLGSPQEVLQLCNAERDHVNLFLSKGRRRVELLS